MSSISELFRMFKDSLCRNLLTNLDAKGAKRSVKSGLQTSIKDFYSYVWYDPDGLFWWNLYKRPKISNISRIVEKIFVIHCLSEFFLPPYNSSILAFILDINHSTHRCTRRYELGPFQAYQFTVVIGGDKSYKEICSFKNVFTYQQLLGIFWWKMDRKSFIR